MGVTECSPEIKRRVVSREAYKGSAVSGMELSSSEKDATVLRSERKASTSRPKRMQVRVT